MQQRKQLTVWRILGALLPARAEMFINQPRVAVINRAATPLKRLGAYSSGPKACRFGSRAGALGLWVTVVDAVEKYSKACTVSFLRILRVTVVAPRSRGSAKLDRILIWTRRNVARLRHYCSAPRNDRHGNERCADPHPHHASIFFSQACDRVGGKTRPIISTQVSRHACRNID